MNAKGETRNQPIAARKVSRARLPAEWHFSQSQPGAQDVIKEIGVLRRINAILAAGENCDGPGCNAGRVRRGIDAARKAGYGGKSSLTKSARQPLGDLHVAPANRPNESSRLAANLALPWSHAAKRITRAGCK
jgi:hypothetical protein